MLILNRNPDQSIFIGDNIIVSVLGVSGNQVRFGIDAPAHVAVCRNEKHEEYNKVRDDDVLAK